MKRGLIAFLLSACVATTGHAAGPDVKSAVDLGYKGAEEARYNALVKSYAGEDCRALKRTYAKADKQASQKVGGSGALGGILKQVGGSSPGLKTGMGVVKDGNKQVATDAKIRRSAAKEVMAAKNCR